MDVTATLEAPCSTDELFVHVDDLDRYPDWLEIVPRVGPSEPDPSGEPAWSVELRGRLGPLARSKRLRMVRVALDERHVRFERRELDGKQHSPWVLDATVEPDGDGSRLVMKLHYGGGFGGSLLERMLRDEIDKSRSRLLDLVT